jgi:hypothetical protein
MVDYTFKSWLRRRRNIIPVADRILPLLKGASTTGMSQKQIGSAVDLDRDTLDDLLGGLVNAGLVIFSWEPRGPVYRATSV